MMMMTTTTEPRRRELWPVALAASLLAMIAVCAAFFTVAATHPDPPLDLEQRGLRAYEGYVAPRGEGGR